MFCARPVSHAKAKQQPICSFVRLCLLCGLVLLVGLQSCATTASRKDREGARISYDLGITAFERGDGRGSLRDLLAAVARDPGLPEAHHALGLVYHSMGRDKEALEHYRTALRLRPKFSEAYNNMGVLLLDLGRYDEAISAFDSALADLLYATPTLAQGNLGWAYYKKGDVTLAREHIGVAVAQDPHFCRGYEWLMRIALDEGEGVEVVAQGKRYQHNCLANAEVAKQLSPSYRRQMDYFLAMGHIKSGQIGQAVALLSQCAAEKELAGSEDADVVGRCQASLAALQ